jgi:hypothetical protein
MPKMDRETTLIVEKDARQVWRDVAGARMFLLAEQHAQKTPVSDLERFHQLACVAVLPGNHPPAMAWRKNDLVVLTPPDDLIQRFHLHCGIHLNISPARVPE